MIDVLIVRPDGTAEVKSVGAQVKAISKIVGGYVTQVRLTRGVVLCDEDGRPKHLPLNPLATRMAKAAGWAAMNDALYGTVVFCTTGPTDWTSVTPELILLARQAGALKDEG